MRKLEVLPHRVSEVVEFRQTNTRDLFKTKSGGTLAVLFALPFDLVKNFFDYDHDELAKIPEDIRGLRSYRVEGLPAGQIGGTEFHRIRQEIVFGLGGRVRWECRDLFGEIREFILTPENGLYMPPTILHTYHVEEGGSGLGIICNTLFPLPADEATNDTYSQEKFETLTIR